MTRDKLRSVRSGCQNVRNFRSRPRFAKETKTDPPSSTPSYKNVIFSLYQLPMTTQLEGPMTRYRMRDHSRQPHGWHTLDIECKSVLLLLLRRAPRALEGGPSERQHLLGVGREDSEWGRRTTKGVLSEETEVCASLQVCCLLGYKECWSGTELV